MDEPEMMRMSDDGQTAPCSPSVFSDLPTRVDSAHCPLVVRWDCQGALTMRKLMAKLLFRSHPSFPPFRLAELTQKLRPLVLELQEFDPKLVDIILCQLELFSSYYHS